MSRISLVETPEAFLIVEKDGGKAYVLAKLGKDRFSREDALRELREFGGEG